MRTDRTRPQLFKRYITLSMWIVQLVSPILIHWMVIYPVHNVIHLLNNRGLMDKNYVWHDNRRHTWNRDTIAQRKSSKLLLEVTSSPSAFLNSNFPPNKFIPRIANANMNRKSRPKKVITLVMVLITTSNWYRTGLTSLKMRRSLMLRNTDRAEFPLERSISQTLKFKRRWWRY